jgi:hypothetical protein
MSRNPKVLHYESAAPASHPQYVDPLTQTLVDPLVEPLIDYTDPYHPRYSPTKVIYADKYKQELHRQNV